MSVRTAVERVMPAGTALAVQRGLARLRGPLYRGDRVACPCCGGRFRRFLAGGVRRREGARCPGCNSLERHRLLWLYLERRSDLFTKPHRVLHFAPEPQLARHLASLPQLDYRSADLASPLAMQKIDVTQIPYPDGAFDVVLCCHVLEHVPDDRRAMRELRRVLAPGGWAILQTPVHSEREVSLEDPTVTDPEARRRLFGQPDHVRIYGRDFFGRLEEAGFAVRRDRFAQELDAAERARFGLRKGEAITRCEPAAPEAPRG